jgi:hypothetical protein
MAPRSAIKKPYAAIQSVAWWWKLRHPALLIITEAEFLFQLLIIALDPPPQLCDIDQEIEGDILRQRGKPILGRLGFSLRPLDQQPLCRARLDSLVSRCAGRTLR